MAKNSDTSKRLAPWQSLKSIQATRTIVGISNLYRVFWRLMCGRKRLVWLNTIDIVILKFPSDLLSPYSFKTNLENHKVDRGNTQNTNSQLRRVEAWAIQKSWSIDARMLYIFTRLSWTWPTRFAPLLSSRKIMSPGRKHGVHHLLQKEHQQREKISYMLGV